MHPVEHLCQLLDQIGPYPRGVVPIPHRMTGTAFFPGGCGLWDTAAGKRLPPMPVGGVILGHDFHCEDGYYASFARNGEDLKTNSTWRGLLALLAGAAINPSDCFFTNFFSGLRVGSKSMGTFPGRRDDLFVHKCREFFFQQLMGQHPRIILTLGSHVPSLIAPLSAELTAWKSARSFRAIDASVCGPLCRASFKVQAHPPISATVIALTHPCMRSSNVHRRRYGDLAGDAAELRMLSAASGIKRAFN